MCLKNTRTGRYKKARVSQLEFGDQQKIIKSEQYKFDWKLERRNQYDLYKIYLLDEEDEILGLLSLKDVKEELRIHINLIEISITNVGRNKKYDRIAGCLLAFAAQLAFNKSYDGFVSLIPKTELIDHYCEKYGFRQFGRQLGLNHEAAINLIKKHL